MMCGLFGFVSTDGYGPDLARLYRIALDTQTRGRHAYGLAWIDSHGMHTWKRPGSAGEHGPDRLRMVKSATLVIGHCRYATHGDPEVNENNHPHRSGRGVLVHNGVVVNFADLADRFSITMDTQCDSEVLAKALPKLNGNLRDRGRQLLRVQQGLCAMLGLWQNPNRMLIARSGNPIWVAETDHGIYLASRPHALPGSPSEIDDNSCFVVHESRESHIGCADDGFAGEHQWEDWR